MSSKVILFLVLTSSSNVFIMLFYFFFNFCLLITPFYLYILYNVFGIYGRKMIRIGLESNFVIIRIPGSLPFYIKMLLIGELSPNGGLFLFIFMSSLLLNSIITINNILNINYKVMKNKGFMFLIFFYIIFPFF